MNGLRNKGKVVIVVQIEKIKQLKSGLYQLDLDNQQQLQVSEDVLVKFRLLKGKELTTEEIEQIKQASMYDYGLQQALNYLSYQLRTEKEIIDYLLKKEISHADITRICQYLKAQQLLDDLAYAKSYLRTSLRLSDKGPMVIRQKLSIKGVSDSIIQQVLLDYTPEIQLTILKKSMSKMLQRSSQKSHYQQLQKIKLAFVQKGFSYGLIETAMQELAPTFDEEEEFERLVKEADKFKRRIKAKNAYEYQQKLKQKLCQKGYQLDLIQQYLEQVGIDDYE